MIDKIKKNAMYLLSSIDGSEQTPVIVKLKTEDQVTIKFEEKFSESLFVMTIEDFKKYAIREMCKYCELSFNEYLVKGKIDVLIDEEGSLAVLGDDFSKHRKIKYCPMCGSKVKTWKQKQMED